MEIRNFKDLPVEEKVTIGNQIIEFLENKLEGTGFDFANQCISCQSSRIVLVEGNKVLWERNTGRRIKNPSFRIKATVIKELPNKGVKTIAARRVKILARYHDMQGNLVSVERIVERWKLYRFDWKEAQ